MSVLMLSDVDDMLCCDIPWMLQNFHWKKREEFEGFSYSNVYGEGAGCSSIKYDNFILFIFIFMIIYYYCGPFTLYEYIMNAFFSSNYHPRCISALNKMRFFLTLPHPLTKGHMCDVLALTPNPIRTCCLVLWFWAMIILCAIAIRNRDTYSAIHSSIQTQNDLGLKIWIKIIMKNNTSGLIIQNMNLCM